VCICMVDHMELGITEIWLLVMSPPL